MLFDRCLHVRVPRDGLHASVNANEGMRGGVCTWVCRGDRVAYVCACVCTWMGERMGLQVDLS